jgi:putative ABC transport system permease protein
MLSLRTLLRHPIQFALMTLGIALGVAVMVGIDLANASAERAFDLSASADHGTCHPCHRRQRRGGRGALRPSAHRPAVAQSIRERADRPRFCRQPAVGGDSLHLAWHRPVRRSALPQLSRRGQGFDFQSIAPLLTQPGAILLSAPTAERYGLTPCTNELNDSCRLDLSINGGTRSAYLVGLLEPSNDFARRALDTLIITDIATAQSLTGHSRQNSPRLT